MSKWYTQWDVRDWPIGLTVLGLAWLGTILFVWLWTPKVLPPVASPAQVSIGTVAPSLPTADTVKVVPKTATTIRSPRVTYTVVSGDTLTGIARRFCRGEPSAITRIATENGIRNVHRIRIGQPLVLSCATSPETVSVSASPEEFAVTGGASRDKHISNRSGKPSGFQPIRSSSRPTRAVSRPKQSTEEALARIRRDYGPIIDEAARDYSVPAALITALIFVESAGNPGAVSRTGCLGLMQLLTSSARKHGVDTTNIMEPRVNIRGGAKIFSDYHRLARGDLMKTLTFYNVGPGDAQKAIRAGTLDPETFGYAVKVRRVMRVIERESAARP